MACGIETRVNLLERLSSCFGLRRSSIQTVVKGEEWLTHGVAVTDFGVVDKSDFPHAPAD